MKRLLLCIALLSILISCKKSSYVAKFDKLPQERAAEQIALVSSTLTSSENGWVATLPTGAGGGYGFYMNFDKEQNVVMVGDLTATSSSTSAKSYYRVKQDMGTELVFDSYNYISMLDDPNGSVMGGVSKVGFSSDIEFTYDRINADSIVFIGKKYRQPFILKKATAAQKASYMAGDLKPAIDKFNTYFTNNKFAYIEMVSGATTIKVGVSPNLSGTLATGKRIDFTGVLADGKTIATANSKFAYNLDGLSILNGGLVYQGITFVRIAWKDASTLAVYDSTGKEYIIKNNNGPLVNINLLWGTKFSGLLSPFKTIYPGTTQKGMDILNYFHNNLTNAFTGYTFNSGKINLTWNVVNQRLVVDGFSSQNGGTSGWTTTATYGYTVDANGYYKFTLQSAPSGGYVSTIMVKMYDFLANNKVIFDYYQDGAITYGKMSSADDPTIVMTFTLL